MQRLTLLVAAALAIGCETALRDTGRPDAPGSDTPDNPAEDDIESGGGSVPDFEAMDGEEIAGYFQAVMDGSEPEPDFNAMTDEEAAEYVAAMVVAAVGAALSETDASSDQTGEAEHWGCGDWYPRCEYRNCPVKLTGDFGPRRIVRRTPRPDAGIDALHGEQPQVEPSGQRLLTRRRVNVAHRHRLSSYRFCGPRA